MPLHEQNVHLEHHAPTDQQHNQQRQHYGILRHVCEHGRDVLDGAEADES